jgi:flagellar hook-length control protein FliK
MDNIGSMNSLRDDTATAARIGKNAAARRANDQESAGAFDDLLAGLVVPNAVTVQAPIQQETPQVSEATPNQTTQADQTPQPNTGAAASTSASATASAGANARASAGQVEATLTGGALTPTAPAASSQALAQSQSDGEAVLAQLTSVGMDDQVATLQGVQAASLPTGLAQAATGRTTPPGVTTNAATLSASRSNAGAAAALQGQAEPSTPPNGTSPTTGSVATTSPVGSNDNAALVTQSQAKPTEIDLTVKAPGQPLEAVATTLDGAGSTSVVSGQEVATPANDQANRAPQLTPQTIPMLAATMMRRLESGSKQFTMRLDPPELGQVEVKLTVAADKKVRAVVSADRPEALADLVRSARELARALAEAGLDLEDNGLTFQMNDPSSGGQQQDARDRQDGNTGQTGSHVAHGIEAQTPVPANKIQKPSDPFERWQRARIALTA